MDSSSGWWPSLGNNCFLFCWPGRKNDLKAKHPSRWNKNESIFLVPQGSVFSQKSFSTQASTASGIKYTADGGSGKSSVSEDPLDPAKYLTPGDSLVGDPDAQNGSGGRRFVADEIFHYKQPRSSIPDLPTNILISMIAPFIGDRATLNSFSMVCKEVWEGCKREDGEETFLPPWPRTLLDVGRRLWSVSFSHDHRTLAIGATNGTVYLFDRRRGPLEPLTGHLGRVYSIVFTSDGKIMATLSGDGDLRIWSMEDLTLLKQVTTHTTHAVCLAFDKNTMRLATGGEGDIKFYSVPCGVGLDVLTMAQQRFIVESVAFSPDGKRLAIGTGGSTIHVWDMTTRECIQSFHESSCVHSVAYSPDGIHLVSGTDAQTIRIWNTLTGEYMTLEGHEDLVWSVTFSPDGEYIASSSDDGTVRIWSVATQRCLEVMGGHSGHSVYSVAFSPDGSMVASTSDDGCVELRKPMKG